MRGGLFEGGGGGWYSNAHYELVNNFNCDFNLLMARSSHQEVFQEKGVLKLCSNFTGEHPCRSAISIKLQSSFIETTLWHECSPSNLLYIFRTPFPKNTSGWLLLLVVKKLGGRWGEDRSPLASPGSYCPVNSVARVSMWQILPENNLEIK